VQGHRSTRASTANDEQSSRYENRVLSGYGRCSCDHQAETKFLSPRPPRRNGAGAGQLESDFTAIE